MPLGAIEKNITMIRRSMTERIRKTTRYGTLGFKIIITTGSVINIATPKDASSDVETTIGIALINSPIMPVAKRRGTKAHTVVSVVEATAVLKSRQTRSPASIGVNFSVR